MPTGPWGPPPLRRDSQPPDLEEYIRRLQEWVKRNYPGGNFGSKGLFVLALASVFVWAGSGFFRVQPDEHGVVLRFGKMNRMVQPGLNYHLPYPIEQALTPKVTRINRVDVGMRLAGDTRRVAVGQEVPEEGLMLTGDENIVDINFAVFWRVSPDRNGTTDYLFNVRNQESTVKAVAESAMREVIGRSLLQPILTEGRQIAESAVQELMQTTLDQYGAGILVTQVQLQKVDPPQQVIDAFRDVQAARADGERAQNQAQAYANRVIPEARGQVAQIIQAAEAYREQSVVEAKGQAARFLQVYGEYAKAPVVTRRRLHIETMERLFAGKDKIIIDADAGGTGVVPYLPLNELTRQVRRPTAADARGKGELQ
ncbi:FtsH protease activity modulator HflK [Bradyrhizobium sp. CCBAU 051011]|uniref:FtsH protease activity modulator HflK n=1 Tax=Bradyrhizobium sp. CCBAU 051011 TaxID=858422 RepID=UPI001373BCCD|nr:FtsH protease activity modulator HflK [Bradyrhizobium sp. CCBAU 051011]QHO75679.1 FtsH protease activity modulator HflK [Bradyrhizobium sp. CCBAU 051011]